MIPTDLVRAAYDRQAADYDALFAAQQRPKIQALAAALPPKVRGPEVDLGAGTGLVARTLGRRVLAVDLSAEMLRRGPPPAVQANLRALPLAGGAFGLAWSVTALLDDAPPAPAIAECARVLRPGGHLALSTLARGGASRVERALIAAGFSILDTLQIPPDIGWICRLESAG